MESGGIGDHFGASLHRAGQEVWLTAQGEPLKARGRLVLH